jgi:inner membrane protein
LGRVYLDWAAFPVVTDSGHANLVASDELAPDLSDTAVEFRDLRFSYPVLFRSRPGASTALIAWIYVTPNGTIAAMVMNGRLQVRPEL